MKIAKFSLKTISAFLAVIIVLSMALPAMATSHKLNPFLGKSELEALMNEQILQEGVNESKAEVFLDLSQGQTPVARKADINTRYAQLAPTFPTGEVKYEIKPNSSAPYAAGKLKAGFLQDGINTVNFLRFLAGVPDSVTLSSTYNDEGQHGAVLMAAHGSLSHSPPKPSDMPQAFYDIGIRSASTSNIYQGMPTLHNAVVGFTQDSDPSNIAKVGHRRWIINPTMSQTGFGMAESKAGTPFITMQAHDRSAAVPNYDTICWPSGPAFPNDVFTGKTAWSITLNPVKYQTSSTDLAGVTVSLVENSTGKTWGFSNADKNTSGKYFNIDTSGFGVSNAIVFRPDGISTYNGTYTATINGVKDTAGAPVVLTYSVEFFKLGTVTPPTPTDTISITVSTKGYGDASGGGTFKKGDRVTLKSTPDSGYQFDGWFNASNNAKLSTNRTYSFNATKNMDIYAKFSVKATDKNNTGKGGGGGGGGGGGSQNVYRPATPAVTTKPIKYSDIKKQIDSATKAATGNTVAVSVKNPSSISAAEIKLIAQAGSSSGKNITVYADTSSTNAKVTQGRLYLDTFKLKDTQTDIKLGVYTSKAKTSKVKALFEKTYKNTVSVISFDHSGSFGAILKVAAKADLEGLNTKTLVFYTFDGKTGKLSHIPSPSYSVDKGGYLHFWTEYAGYIVISDKALQK